MRSTRPLALAAALTLAAASFAAGLFVERLWLAPERATADGPNLLSPAEGDVLANGWQAPNAAWEFRWADVPGADGYELNVTGPGETAPTVNEQIAEPHYRHAHRSVMSASSLTGWTWKVRTHARGRWSKWSDIRTFHLQASVDETLPSKEEVLTYLEGKELRPASSSDSDPPLLIQREKIAALEISQSRIKAGSEPWSTSVRFIADTARGRYAVEGSLSYESVENKRAFHGFEVTRISRQ